MQWIQELFSLKALGKAFMYFWQNCDELDVGCFSSEKRWYIECFSYDGQGPDAYFYAGESGQPSRNGYIIANEKGSTDILGAYRKKDIVLTLPGGRTLKKIKWVKCLSEKLEVFIGKKII